MIKSHGRCPELAEGCAAVRHQEGDRERGSSLFKPRFLDSIPILGQTVGGTLQFPLAGDCREKL